MKAVRLNRFGGPEVLEVVEVPIPVPGDGEILVRVRAAGINFFEALMRENRYAVTPDLPAILGVEIAGVVEDAGKGAGSHIGSRVAIPLFAAGRSGGYAECVAVDAAVAVKVPDDVSMEIAVALMVQGLTALHLVRRHPPKDKTVLVTAAAGGVGSLLVQLAKRAGAKSVIAAASTEEKLELARSLGADQGVNYANASWADAVRDATGGTGVDMAFDFVGGNVSASCLEGLAPRGELVFGALGRFTLDAHKLELMLSRNQSLSGFALVPLLTVDTIRASLRELFELVTENQLKVLIGGVYALDQVAEAHRRIDSRRSAGKIVLVP